MQMQRTNVDTAGKERVGRAERVAPTLHTPPCGQLMASGDLPHSTGSSALSCDDLEVWDGVGW